MLVINMFTTQHRIMSLQASGFLAEDGALSLSLLRTRMWLQCWNADSQRHVDSHEALNMLDEREMG